MRAIRVQKNACLIVSLLFACASPVQSTDFKRFEIQPFGGFTASGGIPLEGDNQTQVGTVGVKSSYNAGVSFGINMNEEDAIEVLWRRHFSEGRLPSAIVTPVSLPNAPSFDLKIDQYHCNFLHHYMVSDPRAFPYVMGGLGVTTYYAGHDGQSNSLTRFSFALGGGIKYFFTPHFGLRGEARWAPTLLSASDSDFWCRIGGAGAQCTIHLRTTLQHQLDMTGGVVFRF